MAFKFFVKFAYACFVVPYSLFTCCRYIKAFTSARVLSDESYRLLKCPSCLMILECAPGERGHTVTEVPRPFKMFSSLFPFLRWILACDVN
jgi:hypothetical protein